jgi:hypothetical protein
VSSERRQLRIGLIEVKDMELICSNGESYWGFPEEFGNYESHEPIDQITTIQRNNEGDEYGDDEGALPPFL